jgi:hypothetical protein
MGFSCYVTNYLERKCLLKKTNVNTGNGKSVPLIKHYIVNMDGSLAPRILNKN